MDEVILDRFVWCDAQRVSPEAPVVVLSADDDEIRLGHTEVTNEPK